MSGTPEERKTNPWVMFVGEGQHETLCLVIEGVPRLYAGRTNDGEFRFVGKSELVLSMEEFRVLVPQFTMGAARPLEEN
jgi:hypothetical protein